MGWCSTQTDQPSLSFPRPKIPYPKYTHCCWVSFPRLGGNFHLSKLYFKKKWFIRNSSYSMSLFQSILNAIYTEVSRSSRYEFSDPWHLGHQEPFAPPESWWFFTHMALAALVANSGNKARASRGRVTFLMVSGSYRGVRGDSDHKLWKTGENR